MTTFQTSPARRAPRGGRAARGGGGGFTLVESLMAVVIVSGVLVASLGTIGAVGRARFVQIERAAAAQLAGQVVGEVLQCAYQEPSGAGPYGPDAGETTRAGFDDVDDYDNWQSNGAGPTLRDGTALDGYAGWKVKVRVDPARLSDPRITDPLDTGLKRIRVTVTTPAGVAYEMYAMRGTNGPYEQAPTELTTYLTFGGVSARVGDRGKTIHGGAHPLNVTTSQ
jgi:type II secretory pathway pseudopilin PulG